MLPAGLAIALPISEIIADIGISTIVTAGVKNVIKPVAKNIIHKGCIYAGEVAITAVVCDKANDSIENAVYEAIEYYTVWKEHKNLKGMLTAMEEKNNGK